MFIRRERFKTVPYKNKKRDSHKFNPKWLSRSRFLPP